MENKLIIKTLSPVQYKKLKTPTIMYGFVDSTPFGGCLMGLYESQICYLAFCNDKRAKALKEMKSTFLNTNFKQNDSAVKSIIKSVFNSDKVKVVLIGSEFQINVWKKLIDVQVGETVTYSRIAELIGKEKAYRAVANCVAGNKIAYLIPCHRIVCKNGDKFKYHWGPEVKKSMLDYEYKLKQTN